MIKNLWKYRHLVKRLAVSDFKVRYKNSVLGFFWSLLEPLLMLLVLYVVFGGIFQNPMKNYHLFLLLGIVLWDFFTKGSSMGLNGIIGKAGMVRQVYIPREILIFSSSLTAMMMAALEFVVFGIFMAISGLKPTLTMIYLPLIFTIIFILVFGSSLALGALNTYYRDVQYIWAIILQAGFFASGIFMDFSTYQGDYKGLLLLNPMARMIMISRDAVLNNKAVSAWDLTFCFVFSLVILLLGYLIFIKLEPGFAEEV